MAARRKNARTDGKARKARPAESGEQASLIGNVQQVWLAGIGATPTLKGIDC